METILNWVEHAGYLGLFLTLAFGVIGVPVPDEAILMFAGFLCYEHRMDLRLALLTGFASSICGVSLTYLLGRTFGWWLIHRYGPIVHITPQRLEWVHQWFERYGRWTIFLGYFIPGLRQGVPYAAGMAGMSFWLFAAYCFTSGFLWAALFVGAGFKLGPQWQAVLDRIQVGHLAVYGLIVLVVAAYVAIQVVRWRRSKREEGFPDR